MMCYVNDLSLRSEIGLACIIIRQLPEPEWEKFPMAVSVSLHNCALTGFGTVARLVLTQHYIENGTLSCGKDFLARPGLDSGQHRAMEIAGLPTDASDLSPIDEIALTRMAIRRVIIYWQQKQPELKEIITLARLIFRGINAVRRLIVYQCTLMEGTAGDLPNPIEQALDELSLEWGIEL